MRYKSSVFIISSSINISIITLHLINRTKFLLLFLFCRFGWRLQFLPIIIIL